MKNSPCGTALVRSKPVCNVRALVHRGSVLQLETDPASTFRSRPRDLTNRTTPAQLLRSPQPPALCSDSLIDGPSNSPLITIRLQRTMYARLSQPLALSSSPGLATCNLFLAALGFPFLLLDPERSLEMNFVELTLESLSTKLSRALSVCSTSSSR